MSRWNPLFLLPPETAHGVALRALQAAGGTSFGRSLLHNLCGIPSHDPVELQGLRFRNRIGLAAGWDKDALGLAGLAAMGFGHIEIGTVTPRPQPGNPKPRVFRLREDRALINRMGFPGRGAAFVADRIDAWRARNEKAARPVLGVNLGRNKDTPNERAVDDYAALVQMFAERADYLTINISSPNTQGLRDLQAARAVETLVRTLVATRAGQAVAARPPLWLKIAPDLGPEALSDTVDAALGAGIDGFIATNTTLARPDLNAAARGEVGGLSGKPLAPLARNVLKAVVAQVGGRVPVIASGGISSAADVAERLADGASLVQVWTGMIYGGPRWPRAIVRSLAAGKY